MAKLMHIVTMTAAVIAFATPAYSNEKSDGKAPVHVERVPPGDAAEELEAEEDSFFSAGFDNDLFSAYVWRNAVQGDELVWQPCVWADFNFEWFTLGGYVWQNWDLTANPTKMGHPREMSETDFNVHVTRSLWTSEDEEFDLGLEIGNDFFTYRQWEEDVPNSYEFYLKLTFDNPYVGVYGQYSQAYEPVVAPYFELGLCKEATLAEIFSSESEFLERLTVGADWNMSFASGKYFTNYLYGPIPGDYDPEEDDYADRDMSNGVGGTTVKGTVAYQVCDRFSVGFVIAYTALLSGEARDAMDWAENGSMYKQLIWGGLQAKVEF